MGAERGKPLTTAEVDAIKARGGQITYNSDGDRRVTYGPAGPAWSAAELLELRDELYGRPPTH